MARCKSPIISGQIRDSCEKYRIMGKEIPSVSIMPAVRIISRQRNNRKSPDNKRNQQFFYTLSDISGLSTFLQ